MKYDQFALFCRACDAIEIVRERAVARSASVPDEGTPAYLNRKICETLETVVEALGNFRAAHPENENSLMLLERQRYKELLMAALRASRNLDVLVTQTMNKTRSAPGSLARLSDTFGDEVVQDRRDMGLPCCQIRSVLEEEGKRLGLSLDLSGSPVSAAGNIVRKGEFQKYAT